MTAVVGSAEFQLAVNLGAFNAGFDAAQRQAAAGSAKIEQSISGNFRKIEQSSARASGSLMDFVRIGTAITAIPAGLALISAGMATVSEQTQRAQQAQFALNKAYGVGAEQFRAFAQAQAQATGRSAVDFQQASVGAATLAKNYGLTSAQIQTLIKRSADLAAVHGKEIPDAAQRVTAAIRGEAEAAEALGLTLNSDAVKAFANMTDEQRKNFESLDQITKAQIIYRELLRQTEDVQGAAAEAVNTQAGAFKRLEAATNDLAASFGERLAPALTKGANAISGYLEQSKAVESRNAAMAASVEDFARRWTTALGPLSAVGLFDLITGRATRPDIADTRAADEGRHEGADVTEAARARANAEKQAAGERKRRIEQELKDRKDQVERRAQIEIDGLEKEKEAAERSYQARRAALENQKAAELKAAEQKRDGAIKAIEEEADAAEEGYRRQIIAAEKARDALLRAAEDKRDGALKAIEAESDAAKAASEAQIRQFEIARDRAKQAAEDRRDAGIDALDAEKRERENARIQEDRAREDDTRAVKRDIDARHDAVVKGLQDEIKAAERASERKVRALDREVERAQRAAQKRIDAIEAEAGAEQERHRAALQNLQDEEAARLRVLDAQLEALDAQEKAADAAERQVKLQEALADAQEQQRRLTAGETNEAGALRVAQTSLSEARWWGDPVEIAQAEEAVRKAEQALADAQLEVRENLAKAEQAIQKETTDQTRDGERSRLQAAKDAVTEEIAARKRAEDDQNRQRERELAADRDAVQKRLASKLAGLEAEKRAAQTASKEATDRIRVRLAEEQESHDLIVEQQRDIAEQAKRAVEDRRRAEDQADQDKRKEIADTYEEEQRQIKATYDDEETGVIPALRRASEAAEREYGVKREIVNATYQEEQDQIKATYDDPEFGIIAKLREQAKVAAEEYAKRKESVNEAYKAEQDRIRETYDDPENGLFAKLEKAKQDTIDSLNAQVEKWRQWKTDTVKEISDALEKLDEFIRKVKELDDITIGNQTPDDRGQVPGGVGPPIPRGFQPGGDLAAGPVVRGASPESYWTDQGTHAGGPAADIFAPIGTPIQSPVGGTLQPGSDGKGGNWAILSGDDGRYYYFAHGNVPFVGGRVEGGQQIGQVGDTGNAKGTSPHLHYAIATSPGVFSARNGSGDIWGDGSYWAGDGVAPGGAMDELTIDILGRKIRVRRPAARVDTNVGRSIAEALRIAELPADWLLPLAQIAAAESGQRNADGSVQIGTGSSRSVNPTAVNGQHATGLMQTLPSTFQGHAVPGHEDIYNPVDNAAAAARYIKQRYGSPWNTPYFRGGAFSTIGVPGYRDGTMIREPTLLAGLVSGRLGVAGETGQPERLLGVDATREYGRGGGDITVQVNGVGMHEVARQVARMLRRQQQMQGGRG